jgi:outer membrane protein
VCAAPRGAGAAEARELTLKNAIAIALESNLDLRQESYAVDSRSISVRSNLADFLPNLGFSARGSRSYSKQYDTTTDSFNGTSSNSLSLGLSSGLDLFTGFGRTASLKQSRLALDAERDNFARTRQEVVFDVISSFVQAVVDSEFIKVNAENLAAQRSLLERIQAFYQAGKSPIADLYQQQAETANAERQLLLSQRDYAVSKLTLMQTLGIDPGTDCRAVAPDVESIMAEASGLAVGDALEEALARRLDLISQQKLIDAARSQITATRSGYWPTLSLSASAGTSYNSSVSDLWSFSEQLSDANPSASIGLSLSFPLFDRLQTRNAVQQAKIQLYQAQLAVERLKLQIGVQVRQALEDYATAEKDVDVSEARLKYSEQALRSIEARYDVKAATLVEVTQARYSNLQAAYNAINARYNLLLRSIAIAFYRGDIDGITSLFQ